LPEPKREPIGDPYIMLLDEVKKHWKVRLNQAQSDAINEAVAQFKGRRPTPYEYDKVQRKLEAIPVVPAHTRKPISFVDNVRQGFHPWEVVPLQEFDQNTDLPEGWALYPTWDSGNNHRLINAARIAWMAIWNSWRPF